MIRLSIILDNAIGLMISILIIIQYSIKKQAFPVQRMLVLLMPYRNRACDPLDTSPYPVRYHFTLYLRGKKEQSVLNCVPDISERVISIHPSRYPEVKNRGDNSNLSSGGG